jgi:hypothetical protein
VSWSPKLSVSVPISTVSVPDAEQVAPGSDNVSELVPVVYAATVVPLGMHPAVSVTSSPTAAAPKLAEVVETAVLPAVTVELPTLSGAQVALAESVSVLVGDV